MILRGKKENLSTAEGVQEASHQGRVVAGVSGRGRLSGRPGIALPVQPGDGRRPCTRQDWTVSSLLKEKLYAALQRAF